MAAPKGNQFWLARSTHGRKPKFESPEALWEACLEYFKWIDEHPLKEAKLFSYQGEIVEGTANKMRAMTITTLCIFLDITMMSWQRWREDEDLGVITTRAEAVIRSQKFEGAAAELLNPNIIARDLGLSEKTSNEHTGPDGGPIDHKWRVEFINATPAADAAPEGKS